MASADTAAARPPRAGLRVPLGGAVLARGTATLWISLIVLLPLAAVFTRAFDDGLGHFWDAITDKEAVAAIKLTLISSLIVVVINAVMGTLIAWVLVRDEFRGKRLLNSIIDLPFALPTIVASLTLLALYGPNSPIGVHAAYTRVAVVMALLFVTLPFVVRSVQPVLLEVDREMEEAAASLGAPNHRIFRSIILPNLGPAIIAGVALAFARAIGEFGSLVLLTGNIPFKTQAASVYIFGRVQTNDLSGAAAVSVLLLGISVALLFALNLFASWRSRHERA
ncbi:MAG TPA: sulfate ABC transporter permease subunit CysT [Solirubrobacterales bacterium]|jgi:sulfate/thiosulfate transport system permease protein